MYRAKLRSFLYQPLPSSFPHRLHSAGSSPEVNQHQHKKRTGRRPGEDVSECQLPRYQPGLHRGCPRLLAELQRTVRPHEIVLAPTQFNMIFQALNHTPIVHETICRHQRPPLQQPPHHCMKHSNPVTVKSRFGIAAAACRQAALNTDASLSRTCRCG